jgi:hypothetical protein
MITLGLGAAAFWGLQAKTTIAKKRDKQCLKKRFIRSILV